MKLLLGDCKEKLKELSENSVDAIVTDPPYELGFMGKGWDNTGIANNVDMWKECLRVLKPGGHLLSFGGTRTYHRMASAIEDAGFEVRDMIEWVYGSGFPKSLNIGKAVDKLQGNEREVVGELKLTGTARNTKTIGAKTSSALTSDYEINNTKTDITKGTSEWEGWGTALKPAHEPICMARKPLSESTVAENCLKWGTGGINIDGSRVGTEGGTAKATFPNEDSNGIYGNGLNGACEIKDIGMGRFPANLIHDNSEEVRECFPETGNRIDNRTSCKSGDTAIWGKENKVESTRPQDNGGNASRFFKSIIYTSKASKKDRGEGNNHATVKPVALMEYLIKMVTPQGGIVLDPFMGSGTTGVACANLSRNFIGIELEPDYMEISKHRIENAEQKPIQLLMEHRVRI